MLLALFVSERTKDLHERRNTYRMIRDQMMNIVATLPPSDRKSAAEVCNEYPNHHVDVEVMRDGNVPSIMRHEHNLMPEQAQEYSRRDIPFASQAKYEKRK